MVGVPDNNSKPFPAPSPGWPPSGYPTQPPQPIVPPNPDRPKPGK